MFSGFVNSISSKSYLSLHEPFSVISFVKFFSKSDNCLFL